MNIRVIGSPEVVGAFALGGVAGEIVGGRRELLAALEAAEAASDLKILVVEEGVAELARAEVDRLKLTPAGPVLVEIAGVGGPLEGRRTPLDLVRQALGINL